jgi:hypothetical protein
MTTGNQRQSSYETSSYLCARLKMHLETWTTWDEITLLANYRAIGEKLWELLHQIDDVRAQPYNIYIPELTLTTSGPQYTKNYFAG